MMELKFKTKIDLDVFGAADLFGKADCDIITSKVDLEWIAYIELRDWGIKSIDAVVPDQEIEVEISYVNEKEETIEETATIKITDVDVVHFGKIHAPDSIEWSDGWTVHF